MGGDAVQTAINRANRQGPCYTWRRHHSEGCAGRRNLPRAREVVMVLHENVTTAFDLPGYRIVRNLEWCAESSSARAPSWALSARACKPSWAATFRCSPALREDPRDAFDLMSSTPRLGRRMPWWGALRRYRDHAGRHRGAGLWHGCESKSLAVKIPLPRRTGRKTISCSPGRRSA